MLMSGEDVGCSVLCTAGLFHGLGSFKTEAAYARFHGILSGPQDALYARVHSTQGCTLNKGALYHQLGVRPAGSKSVLGHLGAQLQPAGVGEGCKPLLSLS